MADIWWVLRGQPGYEAMCAMSLSELMNWHALAVERAPKKE
nr:hypothetical protein [uncultured Sphingomonas sp.]